MKQLRLVLIENVGSLIRAAQSRLGQNMSSMVECSEKVAIQHEP